MSRVLGAILAGGRATRFGSDKATALLDGTTLIDRVAGRLRPQVDALIVVGRTHIDPPGMPDRPAPDLGPLGGIAGALHHAAAHGYDHVLSVPCDAPALPDDLRAILDAAGDAAFLDALPVVGWWPVSAAAVIDRLLSGDGSRAVRAFADAIGAVGCRTGQPIANVNTPDDLLRLSRSPDAPVPR